MKYYHQSEISPQCYSKIIWMAQIFFLAVLFKDNLDGAKICKHKISQKPSCWYMPILGPTQGHRLSHRGFGIGTNFMKIGVHITRGNTWPRRSVPLFGCFRRSPEHHSILLVTLRSHIYSLRHLGITGSEARRHWEYYELRHTD